MITSHVLLKEAIFLLLLASPWAVDWIRTNYSCVHTELLLKPRSGFVFYSVLYPMSYHRQVEVNGIAPLTFRVSDGCSAD